MWSRENDSNAFDNVCTIRTTIQLYMHINNSSFHLKNHGEKQKLRTILNFYEYSRLFLFNITYKTHEI